MELDQTIKERHSARSFSSKKPNWRYIIEAIDAAHHAPTAGNIFTVRYILVTDKEKIKKLAKASNQLFFENVHYVVVVCSKDELAKKSYDERADRYCRQQSGAAIQNFLLKITDLGYATCWIGAFADEMVKQILTIPEDIKVEAILPIGYEFSRKIKKRRLSDLDTVLFFNKYGVSEMKPVKVLEA